MTKAQERAMARINKVRATMLDNEKEDDTSLTYFLVDVLHYVKLTAEDLETVMRDMHLHYNAEVNPEDDLAQSASVHGVDS